MLSTASNPFACARKSFFEAPFACFYVVNTATKLSIGQFAIIRYVRRSSFSLKITNPKNDELQR